MVVTAANKNLLDLALAHADHIAAERQQTGHDLSELQRAINALEEQIWHAVRRMLRSTPLASVWLVAGVTLPIG